jgi:hypothetical protein
VGFVVDKVALGQVFHRVLRFSPVNFIPSVLHYKEKRKKKLIIFITGLHNKLQGCGASVASAAGPFTPPKKPLKMKAIRSFETWGSSYPSTRRNNLEDLLSQNENRFETNSTFQLCVINFGYCAERQV